MNDHSFHKVENVNNATGKHTLNGTVSIDIKEPKHHGLSIVIYICLLLINVFMLLVQVSFWGLMWELMDQVGSHVM